MYTEHVLCKIGSPIILHEDQNRVMDNHNYQDDDPVDTLSQVSYGLVQHWRPYSDSQEITEIDVCVSMEQNLNLAPFFIKSSTFKDPRLKIRVLGDASRYLACRYHVWMTPTL